MWRDYLELCKPRVVALMLLTAFVGMLLATPGLPPLQPMVLGMLGIALVAGAAASINHLIDRQIDAKMQRTHKRPLPTGKITPSRAISFAGVLAVMGIAILVLWVNTTTALLTVATLIGYAIVYTMFLKRATPQNIVIGGAAGAAPPLLGWSAITGELSAQALLLVLIIFVWTPPHFWALAIHRYKDYANAEIPMLPVTHGIRFTKLSILLYTLLLFVVSILPFAIGMSGWLYLAAAVGLGAGFIYYAFKLFVDPESAYAWATFRFSITYLMLLFMSLLLDHYLLTGGAL